MAPPTMVSVGIWSFAAGLMFCSFFWCLSVGMGVLSGWALIACGIELAVAVMLGRAALAGPKEG